MAFEREREEMVAGQLAARGIRDPRVLDAMRHVPRHRFVPPELVGHAYDDTPLPIGERQTISQPYIVALMSEALALPEGGGRVLEIGTGSGYQAAVLATMGARVLSVELVPALAVRARAVLAELELGDRVRVVEGDGTLGVPDDAPYDGIIVTAGAPQIPRPLLSQLAPGGNLVLPIGEQDVQTLVRLRRGEQGLIEDYLGECRFVKLHGAYGWDEQ
ncbi:MAG TPA: protein-L-isoaspartate(D-aspartate) O-methyltransferase [Candidatus Binatia bacterium]|nr:protein-L-isoaspartate(D-aspartate) O-methyltransferase [Candidatus Binatia bacterium]